MMKRLLLLPILAFAFVLVGSTRAYACGGPGQTCCSGPSCTPPAICDGSNICVLPNQQSCTGDSECASGLCASTSQTPSCGSLECLSAAGQDCTVGGDAACEPGTYCFTVTNKCAADNLAGGNCNHDDPHQCVTGLCNHVTKVCGKANGPTTDGCFMTVDCQTGLTCCTPNTSGCASDNCVNTANVGWCCVASGIGTCTMANELTFCCSGSCDVGPGTCY